MFSKTKYMINEYLQQCGYRVGKLKDHIYLIREENLINYKIDNNQIYVNSINGDITEINGFNTTLTETETLNNRFRFETIVNITINESINQPLLLALNTLRSNKWKVIVENKEGKFFIASVDFTSEFTYTYTFNDTSTSPNSCVLTFTTFANIPTMELNYNFTSNTISQLITKKCEYGISVVKELFIANNANTLVKRIYDVMFDEVIINGGEKFKKVEYNPTSFSLVENYQNDRFTDTITFTIPLSTYKYIWHYNLIEFKNNRYSILIQTDKGNWIATGFQFGYVPSFIIETSEEDAIQDLITITLTHIGDFPLLYSNNPNLPVEEDDSFIKRPIINITNPNTGEVLNTETCINDTQAIRTLFQEFTKTGEPLNRYWVLEGYENVYGFLNIVGVYTQNTDMGSALIVNSSKCATELNCFFVTSLPNTLTFNHIIQTYVGQIEATCDWEILSYPSWLSISQTTGDANDLVTVTITNLKNPTQQGEESVIVYRTGGFLEKRTIVYLLPVTEWLSPLEFHITAASQYVVSYLYGITATDVNIVNSSGLIISKTGNSVSINIPMNNSEEDTLIYKVTLLNIYTNETRDIYIYQDKLYSQWKVTNPNAYICLGAASYLQEEKYIGYTSDNINIKTGEIRRGALISNSDSRCYTTITEWRDTGKTVCEDMNLYKLLSEYISYDSGNNWQATGNTMRGEIIEENSPYCDTEYEWRDTGRTMCFYGNLYKVFEKYYNGVATGETKLGDAIAFNSTECLAEVQDQLCLTYTFCWDNISTTQSFNNLGIRSFNDFAVNWGDLSMPQEFSSTNYSSIMNIPHVWMNAQPKSCYTVRIYGKINTLRLNQIPTSVINYNIFYTDLNVTEYNEIEQIQIERTKINSIDLSNCNNLLRFYFWNHYHDNGLSNLTFPTNSKLQELSISQDTPTLFTKITKQQYIDIINNLPTIPDNTGIVEFCYGENLNGDFNVCELASYFPHNGWLYTAYCCNTVGSIQYKFVDNGTTICEGTTLYSQFKLQSSTLTANGWTAWQDFTPLTLVNRVLLEKDSITCGYMPPNTKWVLGITWECVGESSFFREQLFNNDDTAYFPPTYRVSNIVKNQCDPLCGCAEPVEPIYRWIDDGNWYICERTVETITQWINIPIEQDYVCVDEDKYFKEKEQISYDNGVTWEDTGLTRTGTLFEEKSKDCGFIEIIYRWINIPITDDYSCEGVNKHYKQKEQSSNDNGTTWVDTGLTRVGDLYEENSPDCGWVDTLPLILKYNIRDAFTLVTLPVQNSNVTVNWGDGEIEEITTDNPTHNFQTIGEYIVTISGNITKLYSIVEDFSCIEIVSWGKYNLVAADRAFLNYRNLVNIATDEYGVFEKITNFDSMFSGCSKLASIPSTLFNFASKATTFSSTFYACTLSAIPDNIFSQNPNITNVSYCFYNNTPLVEIPNLIFNNNKLITNFNYCFYKTSTSTPISGVTPVGEDNIELWNRAGVEGYPTTISGTACFGRLRTLTNYWDIPAIWRRES